MVSMETRGAIQTRFSRELISLSIQAQQLSANAERVFWFYTKHDPALFEKLTPGCKHVVEEFRDDFCGCFSDMVEALEVLADRVKRKQNLQP